MTQFKTSSVEILERRQLMAAGGFATIRGTVFFDNRLNGAYIPGISGSQTGFVYADFNRNRQADIGEFQVNVSRGGTYQMEVPAGGVLIRWSETTFGPEDDPRLTPIVPNNREWWVDAQAGQTYTFNFGFVADSAVEGRVYEDKNLSGKFDAGDVPLSGRYIYDDVNRNNRPDANEPFSWSNSNGEWRINGLKPFGHLIKHWYARSEWRGTVPNNDEWFYYLSGQLGINDFGVVRINASLTGASKGKITLPGVTPSVFKKGVKIFYDADGDGVLDKNEKVVTTDSQGRFDFKLGSKKLDVSKIRVLGAKP
jgi:hypothetical protein